MRRFLFETTVFVYALGGEHPYRGPCREIMSKGEQGLIAGEASIELIHEFAYVRARRGAAHATAGLERIDPADATAVDSLVGR